MGKFLILVMLVVLMGRAGLPLKSQIVLNTQPFSCTEERSWKTAEWKNDGKDKLVRKVQVWGGMNEGNIADLSFFAVRKSDSTNLAIGNQDHYQDGEYVQMVDFAPDYILLRHGDSLLFGYQCNVWSGREGTGHLIITVWYFEF